MPAEQVLYPTAEAADRAQGLTPLQVRWLPGALNERCAQPALKALAELSNEPSKPATATPEKASS